ncbi:unnamed protein product [Vitrella brassicaformis CCMP3155]|uniref:Potassium channel tetramerisation-type BTB domain-containing protein n=4 Tax=Vitrella brassicaformis TaxID=1169539 RepID=A0A0G4EPE2_VITBC|nr:unnamed protein product [Vitrella brassicaformis CCMP3155]|eukprot:CEL99299.1 unnamed protein product [Vitrella brassicaformis CCMP3155]
MSIEIASAAPLKRSYREMSNDDTDQDMTAADIPRTGSPLDARLEEAMAACNSLSATSDRVVQELRRLAEEHTALIVAMGGEPQPRDFSTYIQLNVGGLHRTVKRSLFAIPALSGTVVAELFSGRWDKPFVKDSSGRLFLDIHPPAFVWLERQAARHPTAQHEDAFLLPPHFEEDPCFHFHVRRLLKRDIKPADTHTTTASPPPSPPNTTEPEGSNKHSRSATQPLEALIATLLSDARRLQEVCDMQERQRMQLRRVQTFLRDGSGGADRDGDDVVSVDVVGQQSVATTVSTVRELGEHSVLCGRFLNGWQSRVCNVKLDHFLRVIDVARRKRLEKLLARLPPLPGTCTSGCERASSGPGDAVIETTWDSMPDVGWKGVPAGERRVFLQCLEMYGIDHFHLLTNEDLPALREWIHEHDYVTPRFELPPAVGHPSFRCVYRATRDGWNYDHFFEALRGLPEMCPLLLLIRAAGTGEIICLYIEGRLEPGQEGIRLRQWLMRLRGFPHARWTGRVQHGPGAAGEKVYTAGPGDAQKEMSLEDCTFSQRCRISLFSSHLQLGVVKMAPPPLPASPQQATAKSARPSPTTARRMRPMSSAVRRSKKSMQMPLLTSGTSAPQQRDEQATPAQAAKDEGEESRSAGPAAAAAAAAVQPCVALSSDENDWCMDGEATGDDDEDDKGRAAALMVAAAAKKEQVPSERRDPEVPMSLPLLMDAMDRRRVPSVKRRVAGPDQGPGDIPAPPPPSRTPPLPTPTGSESVDSDEEGDWGTGPLRPRQALKTEQPSAAMDNVGSASAAAAAAADGGGSPSGSGVGPISESLCTVHVGMDNMWRPRGWPPNQPKSKSGRYVPLVTSEWDSDQGTFDFVADQIEVLTWTSP